MYCRECGKQIDPAARFCKYCGSPQVPSNNSQQNWGNPQQNWGNPQQNWGNPQQNWGNPQQNWGNPQQNWGESQERSRNSERVQRNITNINFHNPKRGKLFTIFGVILLVFGLGLLIVYIIEMIQYPIGTKIDLDQPFTYLLLFGIAMLILGKIIHWVWND